MKGASQRSTQKLARQAPEALGQKSASASEPRFGSCRSLMGVVWAYVMYAVSRIFARLEQDLLFHVFGIQPTPPGYLAHSSQAVATVPPAREFVPA